MVEIDEFEDPKFLRYLREQKFERVGPNKYRVRITLTKRLLHHLFKNHGKDDHLTKSQIIESYYWDAVKANDGVGLV